MSDDFRASAEIAKQRLDASDFAGAGADAKALLGRAQSPLETYTAAAMLMQASARVMDLKSEKLAIDGLRRSGLVPPARLVELDGILGLVHLGLGENKDAVAVLSRAYQAGARTPKTAIALAEARVRTGDVAGSVAATKDALGLIALSGSSVPAGWYDRGIALAVQQGDVGAQADWTRRKLAQYGTPGAWRSGLLAYLPRIAGDVDAVLDLHRLLAVTGGLTTERDWFAYAAAAEKAGALPEALSALQSGQAKGSVAAGNLATTKQIAALKARVAKANVGQASRLSAAQKAADGASALRVGNELLAGGQTQPAAALYRSGLARTDALLDRLNIRLGIALARAGDMAGARAAWAQVPPGPSAALAGFWLAWLENAGTGTSP